MTRTFDIQSLLPRKSVVGILLAASATLTMGLAAQATGGSGNFRGAVCEPPPPAPPPPHTIPLPPGTGNSHSQSNSNTSNAAASPQDIQGTATSQFITLSGNQVAQGFGGTSAASQLTTDAGGTAGVLVNLSYSQTSPPDNTNDLVGIFIKYKGNANAQKNTTVKFCFINQHGAGNTITFSTTLDQVKPVDMGNGFFQIFLGSGTPGNFGGLNTKTSVLTKVAFTLSPKNNTNTMTIGDVRIGTKSTAFEPVGINLNQGSCNSLFTCPDAGVVVAE
jgi:hypothetical protein